MDTDFNNRILIVDDNAAIHDDFDKLLPGAPESERQHLNALADQLFENDVSDDIGDTPLYYALSHAYSGAEALQMVEDAERDRAPFALAFVDVRMPPGWDGVETVKRIWQQFDHIEMVICTAHSDYSWQQIIEKLGTADKLQFIRKPIDVHGIRQTARVLVHRWNLRHEEGPATDTKQFARFDD